MQESIDFCAVLTRGMMSVYELIKTPFGLLYRKLLVIVVPQRADGRGGKNRRKSKRNNKLNKTKKRKNNRNKNNRNKTKKIHNLHKKKYTRRHK